MATQIQYPVTKEDGTLEIKQGLKRPERFVFEDANVGFFGMDKLQVVMPSIVCDAETKQVVDFRVQSKNGGVISFAKLAGEVSPNGVTAEMVAEFMGYIYDRNESGAYDVVETVDEVVEEAEEPQETESSDPVNVPGLV